MMWFVYEPLFYFLPGTGEFIPRLAVEKELLDGGERVILRLREGVVWHDGDPFCSKDVITTWNLIRAIMAWPEEILDVRAIDQYTVEFVFVAPVPIMMPPFMGEVIDAPYHIFGHWNAEAEVVIALQRAVWNLEAAGLPVPEALQAELKEKRTALTAKVVAFKPPGLIPIGTGPFYIAEVFPFEVYMPKFQDYWAAEYVHFDAIRPVRWVAHEIIWGQLEAGVVDAAHPATGKDLTFAMLEMQPALRHTVVTDLCEFAILLNHRRPPFDCVEFRRALIHVFCRVTIRDVSSPWGFPVDVHNHGVIVSFVDKWLSPEFLAGLTRFEHDLAKAEALFLELGFTRGPDGNWLDPEGQPLEFVMRPYAPHTDWVLAGTEVAEQLTAFGIPTTVLTIPEDMRMPILMAGEFDLTIAFGPAWWGTGHPFTGFDRLYRHVWFQDHAGFEEFPVITIDGVVFDTGALLDQLAKVVCPVEEVRLVEKLAFVTNEWVPGIFFLEKTLQIFHVDGIRATGWPDADDPIWTIAPGGIERAYVLLITKGILRPVE